MTVDEHGMERTRETHRLNLASRLDRLPVSRWHNKIFLAIAGAFFVDSVDLAALTFVLAPISKEFGLTALQTGLVGTSTLLGMLVGASMGGALADHLGRRAVFQYSMLLWGASSLLFVFAWDYSSLLVIRFLIGVGMGAEFPVAQSLMSEFAPKNVRGRYIAFMEGGWPLGFVVAGALSWLLVPHFGWRPMYVIVFVLSLFVFVVRRIVPESPRWYAARGRTGEAELTMEKIERAVEASSGRPLPQPAPPLFVEEATRQFSLRVLFGRDYRRRTLLSWAIWFGALLGYYGITTWLSKLLTEQGMSVAQSIGYVTLISLWGVPAFLTVAFAQERIGRKAMLSIALVGTAVTAFVYGQMTGIAGVIIAGSFMQFFAFMMWAALYTYTAEIFPTRARAAGCGTASALGRLGAAIGPFLVPIVLVNSGTAWVFVLGAGMYLVAAALVITLGPETKQVALEEISR